MNGEPEWFAAFVAGLPCPKCRQHFEEFLRSHPPDFESRTRFFSWTVAAHNFVNRSNGKPEMSLTMAQRIHAFKGDSSV